MGLIDILNGMQNGPRGPSQSSGSGSGKGGGMSPIMMALLGLLAYKAVKSKGSETAAPSPVPSGGSMTAGQQGGEIGDILGGLLRGKPGSASAPAVATNPNSSLKELLPGGLGELLGGRCGGNRVKRRSWRSRQGTSATRIGPGGAIMGGHRPQPKDRVQ